jgi:CheY-like chemotaxis protein
VHSHPVKDALALLHVDDNANERLMVRRAITATHTPFTFQEAECIESAIPYFEGPRMPAIVLLDYDMGRHTGVDFLIWLRVMKQIMSVPVAMFSGSETKQHVAECYSNGANYFINKPNNFDRLKEIVRAVHQSLVGNQPHAINILPEFHPDPRNHRKVAKAV